MGGQPARPWYRAAREVINEQYQRAMAEYETPFDQLYQKEVQLVNDIVKAEKALRQMRDELPDPAGHY